jgi:uncharacterized protein (DUF1697 family)
MPASIFIALLRAIGPATHRKMSMSALRESCLAAGLTRVQTYIQTGNLLIETRRSAASAHATLVRVLRGFDLNNEIIMRRPPDLAEIIAANPFPESALSRASELAVFFLSAAPNPDGLAELLQHPGPERLTRIGRDLCVDYVNGVAGSKLTPAKIERRLGAPTTARNWNSVTRLALLAQEMAAKDAPR